LLKSFRINNYDDILIKRRNLIIFTWIKENTGRIVVVILFICYIVRIKVYPPVFPEWRWVIQSMISLGGVFLLYKGPDWNFYVRIMFWFVFICSVLIDYSMIEMRYLR
jgi:hypothetical protein